MPAYTKESQTKRTRKKKAKPKLRKLRLIHGDLWRLFSVAVRLRRANKYGTVSCITCGAKLQYYGDAKCHAGHFRPRTEGKTKYDFTNVEPQCAKCNTFNEGEQYLFGQWLDKTHGPGTAEALTILGKQPHKFSREELAQKQQEVYEILLREANSKNLWEWTKCLTAGERKELTKLAEESGCNLIVVE